MPVCMCVRVMNFVQKKGVRVEKSESASRSKRASVEKSRRIRELSESCEKENRVARIKNSVYIVI